MRRFIFTCCALSAWLTASLASRADDLQRNIEGDGVKVSLSSPFAKLPPGGSVPLQVTIHNDGPPGTWHVTFRSNGNMYEGGRGGSVYERDLSVKANASATFDLTVPLPSSATSRESGITFQAGITGPGFNESSFSNRNLTFFYTNPGAAPAPFTIIGKELLGADGTGRIEEFYKERRQEFQGSQVEVSSLPTDWRAYAGVAVICLKDSEWLELSTAQHDAICDYVAQGGNLVLFTDPIVAATTPPDLRLPQADGKPGSYGFGAISTQAASFPLDPQALESAVAPGKGKSVLDVDGRFSTWDLRRALGAVEVSSAFILSFVVIFSALVGPVNMFVFARGKKRFRLFWTTPLISIVASLLLLVSILLTDGVGGHGSQMIAVYSLPGANREAVVQEQVARTGVLFSTGWHDDQNYLVTPVSMRSINNAMHHEGSFSGRSGGIDFSDGAELYGQSGNDYSGNWFRSRAVSGQYFQVVRPSRSTLTVLNPTAFAAGQAPMLLSSYPQELTQVYLTDVQGSYWTCGPLEPGVKKVCTRSSFRDFHKFWTETCAPAGGKLHPALTHMENRSGFFYATGLPPANEMLGSLGEIHWQVEQGVYLGPWVASTAPETTP